MSKHLRGGREQTMRRARGTDFGRQGTAGASGGGAREQERAQATEGGGMGLHKAGAVGDELRKVTGGKGAARGRGTVRPAV